MAHRDRRVVWTAAARRDLEEAIAFVAEDSVAAARRLLIRILDAAESLGSLSERGRVVPERRDPSVRELLVEPFRLVYRSAPSHVYILTLLHQRRDFDRWRL